MKKVFLFFMILGVAALGYTLKRSEVTLERQTFFRLLDLMVSSSSRMQASRLGAYLDDRAGYCAYLKSAEKKSVSAGDEPTVMERVPFAQRFSVGVPSETLTLGSERQRPLTVASCRGGLGGDLEIKMISGENLVVQVDRAIGRPLRFTFLSPIATTLAGKDLWLLLRSPLGELEVRSSGYSELSLKFREDSSGRLSKLAISAVEGEFRVTRAHPGPLGADAGMIELHAEKAGRVRWENEAKPVTDKSSAMVLPSGFYWDVPTPSPSK